MKIILPWPARVLHPNARTHWAKKARATKRARRDGYALAITFGACATLYANATPLQVIIIGHPPINRRRDADGLLASMKPYLDGIADALMLDDAYFVPIVKWGVLDPPHGHVDVRVFPLVAAPESIE